MVRTRISATKELNLVRPTASHAVSALPDLRVTRIESRGAHLVKLFQHDLDVELIGTLIVPPVTGCEINVDVTHL